MKPSEEYGVIWGNKHAKARRESIGIKMQQDEEQHRRLSPLADSLREARDKEGHYFAEAMIFSINIVVSWVTSSDPPEYHVYIPPTLDSWKPQVQEGGEEDVQEEPSYVEPWVAIGGSDEIAKMCFVKACDMAQEFEDEVAPIPLVARRNAFLESFRTWYEKNHSVLNTSTSPSITTPNNPVASGPESGV